jgi:hypothetical protein
MDNKLVLSQKINNQLIFGEVGMNLFSDNCPIHYEFNQGLQSKISAELNQSTNKLYFYKITELSYEEDFPQREALENVLSSLNNNEFNFIYLLSGTREGVSIYIGIGENYKVTIKENTVNGYDISQALINSFLGNFLGSKVIKLNQQQVEDEVINKIKKSKRKSFIHGIPSENEETTAKINMFQGIDRLINSMRGETYQYLIVGEPIQQKVIKTTLDEVYQYYNLISRNSETDLSANETSGTNESSNKGSSKTLGKNEGRSSGKSTSTSDGDDSFGKNTGKSSGKSESFSTNQGETLGSSKSFGKTMNVKIIEKELKDQIKYLDEEYIPRLKLGLAKGLFKTAIYAMSNDNATLDKLEGNIKSIFQGEKSTFVPLKEVRLFNTNNFDERFNERTSALLIEFQIFHTKKLTNKESYLLQNIEVNGDHVEMSTYLTVSELSLIGGLPMNEVPGIKLNEAVDFGVNLPDDNKGFILGNIIQRGVELKNNKVKLDPNVLNKHLFISGVTGSGKTTTSQKILLESKFPFLVIEPAKTEYRQLYEFDKSIQFYTVGRNDLSPFKINPMEIVKGETISSHIDLLMATFQAVYPMEASMPYILKEAIINCYEKLGWDLESNENKYSENPWEEDGLYWPIFSNLVAELKVVVLSKKFATELRDNYIGSLVSRFTDLTIGTRGSIFNVPLSMNFEKLIESKVVIELDELKNEEDKVLLMGFVLTRLNQVLKNRSKLDNKFRHITLIEEAHRLLTKPEPGETAKKLAVQTFTDLLAEVRKYGECLIIIDQIPNKLTTEVLKNTNTKIVHKIFAEDDKTAIAHNIALDDKQKQFLSKLKVGETIIFSEGWHKPIWVKIEASSNLSPSEIDEAAISLKGKEMIYENRNLYFPYFKNLKLHDEQLRFLLTRKNSLIRELVKHIIFNPKDNDLKEIKKIINEFERVFFGEELDSILNSLSLEIWNLKRIQYFESDLIDKRKFATEVVVDYLNNVVYDRKFLTDRESEIGNFLIQFNKN